MDINNYIGHEVTKRQLQIAISSAKRRNKALPHMLFTGTAGCGKTTLAKYMSKLSGVSFIEETPDSLDSMKNLIPLVNKLSHEGYNNNGDRVRQIKPTILFIDEIHGLSLKTEEMLGTMMESFTIPSGRSGFVCWVPYFTIVGATTNDGELSKPFRERFKITIHFEPYSIEESIKIAMVHAKEMKIGLTIKAANEIAKRSRGVPRLIVRYLERCIDMALANNLMSVNDTIALETFKMIEVDEMGLTKTEVKLLETLYRSNVPLGLDNLSIVTNEAPKTIKDSIEPYLIQTGLIARGSKGREITQIGKEFLEKTHMKDKNDRIMKVQIPNYYERK